MQSNLEIEVVTTDSYQAKSAEARPRGKSSGPASVTAPSKRVQRWIDKMRSHDISWREKLTSEDAVVGLRQFLTFSHPNDGTRVAWTLHDLGSQSEARVQSSDPCRRGFFIIMFLWVCEVAKKLGYAEEETVNEVQRSFLRAAQTDRASSSELGDESLRKFRLGAMRVCHLLYELSKSTMGSQAWVIPLSSKYSFSTPSFLADQRQSHFHA